MSAMKRYQNPDLYERLSAEYVLGTLTGKARTRFEKLMHERPYIQYSVDLWQDRFGSAVEFLPEEKPPRHVWESIQKEISHRHSSAYSPQDKSAATESGWLARLFGGAGVWKVATAVMSLVLAIMVLSPEKHSNQMAMPSYVAVLEGDHQTPMMVTLGNQSKRVVSVRVMEMPKLTAEQDLQLWAVHTSKSSPIPIGLLRQDNMETQLQLSPSQWQRIDGAQTFAISFEPKGGSPSGQPTGKMMYKGQCLDFI
ncbi:MAG TPA: hypothetical protein DD827_06285 [Gammaproteobacteria bacterium]|nr:hypothetical protein [Gammaproteobacteria bacterium]